MMITVLFYLDLPKKNFSIKSKIKNLKQNLLHQVVEAVESEVEAIRMEAEGIQKLPLPHPCSKC